MIPFFPDSRFLCSAVKEDQYPPHGKREIALVGRSNVGKSSLINAITNRRRLARTSNQPGRTQTINFYEVSDFVLVDLPGYGFAQVPEHVRRAWRPMIETYLRKRTNLAGVLQLVDIRHAPTKDDQTMAAWLLRMQIPAVVVATKADKIARSKHRQAAKAVMEVLKLPVLVFSAESKLGLPELVEQINNLKNTG